ncbi:MAG TPA: DinB family protein [Bryobacteraceae bacterium]|jgi:hypothetical protein|nr:DinB family protein [Bryobacteraceae bacterium]
MTTESTVTSQQLSPEHAAEASRYLADTRDTLLELTAGLSNEQCGFKPSPDRWSIAEIIEHIVIVEQRVYSIIGKLSDAPEPPAGWEQAEVDALVLERSRTARRWSRHRGFFGRRSIGAARKRSNSFAIIARRLFSFSPAPLHLGGTSFRIPFSVLGMDISGSWLRELIARGTRNRFGK